MKSIKQLSSSHLVVAVLLSASLAFSSCKKDEHIPPNITFKTTAGYTSADATVAQGDAILFGIDVQKTEDELSTFDVSVSFDGGSASSIQTEAISGTEQDGFDRDVNITTRNQAGTEKYTFTVTDRDGNITQKSITLTVQ